MKKRILWQQQKEGDNDFMNTIILLGLAVIISYCFTRIFLRLGLVICCSDAFLTYFFTILGVIAGFCLLMFSVSLGVHLFHFLPRTHCV